MRTIQEIEAERKVVKAQWDIAADGNDESAFIAVDSKLTTLTREWAEARALLGPSKRERERIYLENRGWRD
jgi:hypothetical protein